MWSCWANARQRLPCRSVTFRMKHWFRCICGGFHFIAPVVMGCLRRSTHNYHWKQMSIISTAFNSLSPYLFNTCLLFIKKNTIPYTAILSIQRGWGCAVKCLALLELLIINLLAGFNKLFPSITHDIKVVLLERENDRLWRICRADVEMNLECCLSDMHRGVRSTSGISQPPARASIRQRGEQERLLLDFPSSLSQLSSPEILFSCTGRASGFHVR